jgi:hypothetical protein
MTRKYLAFDIETAKILPKVAGDLLAHRPLGICCAATLAADQNKPQLFYSTKSDGAPAAKMRKEDLVKFVDHLLEQTRSGYTIVTLNGLGFDFDVLAEESGRFVDCKQLALSHVDIMFNVFCGKGFGIGLSAAANALGLGKPADVDGSIAPQLWQDGEHQRVLDYVGQDCKITLEVAVTSEKQRVFRWVTKRGTISTFDIPSGWLSVKESMELPLPDTSWMDNPWPRSKFTAWLG